MQETLVQIEPRPPRGNWRNPHVDFHKGAMCYSAAEKNLAYLGLPNPRAWQPFDSDWKLPPDWKKIILAGMKDRLTKYRSFRLFMDICVRCGACADKCQFYIGSADPKNMPVARAELRCRPVAAATCLVNATATGRAYSLDDTNAFAALPTSLALNIRMGYRVPLPADRWLEPYVRVDNVTDALAACDERGNASPGGSRRRA